MNCSICHRETPVELIEEHHLVPRGIAKRNKYADLPKNETIPVCHDCGNQLHKLFSEKELGDNYNTLEKLLADERVQKWVKWVQKKPYDFSICMKTKKRR